MVNDFKILSTLALVLSNLSHAIFRKSMGGNKDFDLLRHPFLNKIKVLH